MNSKCLFLNAAVSFVMIWSLPFLSYSHTSIAGSGFRDSYHRPVLGRIDKVELLSIEPGQDSGKVNRVRMIEGADAQEIARVWRSQKLSGWSRAACHQPPYAIKFYSKGKVVLSASICWACENIDFGVPALKRWVKFDADSREGQELRQVFGKAFLNQEDAPN